MKLSLMQPFPPMEVPCLDRNAYVYTHTILKDSGFGDLLFVPNASVCIASPYAFSDPNRMYVYFGSSEQTANRDTHLQVTVVKSILDVRHLILSYSTIYNIHLLVRCNAMSEESCGPA